MQCLEGTVVLDLARRNPGAYSTMFLADFGAEVIKVDPPPGTLHTREQDIPEERFAAYYALDRNKRSVVLDLKTEGGKQALLRLVERADVLVEGFRPGVMDRLGLGYAALRAVNPRLVYCSLSAFGQDGPYAQTPAHDINFVALGGALSLVGERNGRPYVPNNIVADFGGAGMHAALGIALALLARHKSGRGQFVDISYLDCVISQLAATVSQFFAGGRAPRRGETITTGATPWAQVLRCKDGEYFTVGAAEPHLWANFCRALGREDLIAAHEPRAREQLERVVAELQAIFLTRTRAEWHECLKDKEACVAPVYGIDETLNDPQVIHRQMVLELEHPSLGTVKQMGIPIKLSETPGSVRRLGVPTGSDTEAVLRKVGYADHEIAELRRQGALG